LIGTVLYLFDSTTLPGRVVEDTSRTDPKIQHKQNNNFQVRCCPELYSH